MSTCKDCFHFEVCDSGRHIGEYIEDDGIYSEGVEKECTTFIASADVVEVRHGYWITRNIRNIEKEVRCSVCNSKDFYDYEEKNIRYPNYCSDCGAKMDGGREE